MKPRFVWMLALAAPAALVWACGGTDDSAVDDGGSDGTVGGDTGPGNDGSPKQDGTAGDTGTGNDTGAGNDAGTGNDSAVTDSGGGKDSGTLSLGCTAPSDCDAGFCCGTIVFNGGTLPNCDLADASSQCNATCKSNVKLSCTATDTVRACTTHVECADAGTGYTDCCNVPFGDAAVEFCWSKGLAGLISGSSCL